MFINTYQFKPEDVDCELRRRKVRSTPFPAQRGVGPKTASAPLLLLSPQSFALRGPHYWRRMAERIGAGVVDYEEAIHQTFHDDPHLEARLHTVIQRFPGSLYLTPGHRQRMEDLKARMGYRRKRDTPAYYAAMYLLTANQELYRNTANCFCRHGIEFDYATLGGVSPHNYTLFSAARDIYADASRVMLSDLANGEVVDTLAFSLIVNAILVARYGRAVLDIRERSKE